MLEVLHGRIISKRTLSRRLVFFDLERTTSGNTVELVLRANETLSAEYVHDLRDAIKLGDQVAATGIFEDSPSQTFQVTGILIKQRWKDAHPQQHFKRSPAAHEGALPARAAEEHAGSAQHNSRQQLCKFHVNSAGSCIKGAACPFVHADLAAAPRLRQGWIADRHAAV